MPTISESLKGGIKIAVNYSDHNPPHFHVVKGQYVMLWLLKAFCRAF